MPRQISGVSKFQVRKQSLLRRVPPRMLALATVTNLRFLLSGFFRFAVLSSEVEAPLRAVKVGAPSIFLPPVQVVEA